MKALRRQLDRIGHHFEPGGRWQRLYPLWEAIDTALRLNPREAVAVLAQGVLLRRKGRNAEALVEFDRALSLDPMLVDAGASGEFLVAKVRLVLVSLVTLIPIYNVIFTPYLIEAWIGYKRTKEVDTMRLRPHPYEFFLYYDI